MCNLHPVGSRANADSVTRGRDIALEVQVTNRLNFQGGPADVSAITCFNISVREANPSGWLTVERVFDKNRPEFRVSADKCIDACVQNNGSSLPMYRV